MRSSTGERYKICRQRRAAVCCDGTTIAARFLVADTQHSWMFIISRRALTAAAMTRCAPDESVLTWPTSKGGQVCWKLSELGKARPLKTSSSVKPPDPKHRTKCGVERRVVADGPASPLPRSSPQAMSRVRA